MSRVIDGYRSSSRNFLADRAVIQKEIGIQFGNKD